jgi:hypothetical protein
MVLVLFSVTFFTETNQKRDKGKLVIHQGDISNFNCRIASGGSIAIPTVLNASAGASFIPSPTMATLPYSLRAAILSDLFSGSKLPNTF